VTLVTKKAKVRQLPVIPEGEVAEVTWTRVHVTFQSTLSTNSSTVNAPNANKLSLRRKNVEGEIEKDSGPLK
jgi:hypothetical protein